VTEEESKIAQEAFTWIKDHSKFIINNFIQPDDSDQTSKVLSLFMAGSPGAGKTEVAKQLYKEFNKKPVIS
jgi:Ni2+-binding GTPase involved in maturation of urease and hydrogenase